MGLEIDNTTLALLAVLAVLLLYSRFFSAPTPLVHPLLLGRQSDVSSVRRKGETGVYRSFATGQGAPLAVRPAGGVKTVRDIAYKPKASPGIKTRRLLDIDLTDESLSEVLQLLAKGITTLFPDLKDNRSILTLIPPTTSTTFPLLLLQLSWPAPLVILSSPSILDRALESSDHPSPAVVIVHKGAVEDVVEQVWEETRGKCGVLIIGDPEKETQSIVGAAAKRGMAVKFWEDIWDVAETAPDVSSREPAYGDNHSFFYSTSTPEDISVYKVTHMNVTAGIAGLLSIFPADKRPSSKDVVASSIPLDTPFGMTVALASVHAGAGFRFIGSPTPSWTVERDANDTEEDLLALTDASNGPAPTVLFVSRDYHQLILRKLYQSYASAPLAAFAARHKLGGIQGGDVSRKGLWDNLVWAPIRRKTLDGLTEKSRAVVVVGDAPPFNSLALSYLLLGMPISRVRSSPHCAGPIFASHFYDLQCHISSQPPSFSWSGEQAHTGPPATNVEAMLRGSEIDEKLDSNEKATGRLWIRGPAVLERIGGTDDEGWVDIGEDAAVQTNGTFVFSP